MRDGFARRTAGLTMMKVGSDGAILINLEVKDCVFVASR
jgi:hypothetical protein